MRKSNGGNEIFALDCEKYKNNKVQVSCSVQILPSTYCSSALRSLPIMESFIPPN